MEQLTLETKLDLLKWKQYESTIILLTFRWYLKYSLSYRDIEEMMSERSNDSWRTDETYIKVKGQWKYLYQVVDSMGKTIDFMLSENRDMPAAKPTLQRLCPLHIINFLV
jgi:transposase, IS6 family